MKCPECGTLDTIVFESLPKDFELPSKKVIAIFVRRRRCRLCQVTWTTVETEAKWRIKKDEVVEIIFKHFSIESGDGEGSEGLGKIHALSDL